MRMRGINFQGTETTDDGTGLTVQRIETILSQLKSPTVGLVMFPGIAPATYLPYVEAIKKYGKLLLRPCDSSAIRSYSVREYEKLYQAAITKLRPNYVECGNEINGDWCGPEAAEKMRRALKVALHSNVSRVVTLYLDNNDPNSMLKWCTANKFNAEYVLVSNYRNYSDGPALGFSSIITNTARMFPGARVGIGEYGVEPKSDGFVSMVTEFESRKVAHPQDIGGGFYWDAYRDFEMIKDIYQAVWK